MNCKIEMPIRLKPYNLMEQRIGQAFTLSKEAGAEVFSVVFVKDSNRKEKTVPVFGFRSNVVSCFDSEIIVYPLVQTSCATYKFIEDSLVETRVQEQ